MKKIIFHYAVNYEAYGENRTRSLCGRSRTDIIRPATIEWGQNVTPDNERVTCSFCKRLLPMRLKKENVTHNAVVEADSRGFMREVAPRTEG